MSKEKGNKKKRTLDKIFMGAVIGGAIGSVLGVTIAPKKGSETRKELTKMAKNSKSSSKIFFKRFKKMLGINEKEKEQEIKKIPTEHLQE